MSVVDAARNADGECEFDADYYARTGNNYRQRLEFVIANFWRAAYIRLALGPRTALDAGGGMGLLVERLQAWGCGTTGLEISHYAILQSPPAVRRSFVQGSMVGLPFADGVVETVASVNVFEHLWPADVPAALRECARVAGRSMYLEITVIEDAGVIHRDPTHRTKLRAAEWLQLMRQTLPGWRARRGLHVPYYKNGIFILTKGQEALT
ncbi:MAG: class I SAM-dependent methyltransferase [Anaerolineae bacterium]